MRVGHALTLLAVTSFVGCGGGESSPDVTFPALGTEQDGYLAAAVADVATAQATCDAAQSSWPAEWADADQAVTLDVPDDGSADDPDLICTRP